MLQAHDKDTVDGLVMVKERRLERIGETRWWIPAKILKIDHDMLKAEIKTKRGRDRNEEKTQIIVRK